MECLEDGGEGSEQDHAGEEERDLTRPGVLIKMGVVMFDEQSEDIVDRIGASERLSGRGEPAADGCECCGRDAVEAVDGEEVSG